MLHARRAALAARARDACELDLDAARAVPGVRAVIGPGRRAARRAPRDLLARERRVRRARGGRLAADDAAAAARGLAALAPRFDAAAVRGRPRARRCATSASRTTRAESERGDVEAGLARADVVIEAEYRTPAQVQTALEPNCAVAQWLSEGDLDGLDLDPGHLRRARASWRAPSAWTPSACVCAASSWAAGSARSRAPTIEGLIWPSSSRAARGRPVRLVNDRRAQSVATGHRGRDASDVPHRRHARRDPDRDRCQRRRRHRRAAAGRSRSRTPRCRSTAARTSREQKLPLKLNLGFSNAFRAPGVMEGTSGFEQALDELAADARRSIRSSCACATPSTSTRSAASPTRRSTSMPASAAPPSSPAGIVATGCASANRRRRPAPRAWASQGRSGGAAAGRPRTRWCESGRTGARRS